MAEVSNYTREIEIEDRDLYDLVEKKGSLVEQGRGISAAMEALSKEHDQLGAQLEALTAKVTDIKLKIIAKTSSHARSKLSDYEIPVTTEIKDGKVVLHVTDAMEEFKESFKRFDKFKDPVPKSRKPTPVAEPKKRVTKKRSKK